MKQDSDLARRGGFLTSSTCYKGSRENSREVHSIDMRWDNSVRPVINQTSATGYWARSGKLLWFMHCHSLISFSNECNNVKLVYSIFFCFIITLYLVSSFLSTFPSMFLPLSLSLSSHFLSSSSSLLLMFSFPLILIFFFAFNYVTNNLSFVYLLFPISLSSYCLHRFWLPSLLSLCLYFLYLT